jgi:TonB family protein
LSVLFLLLAQAVTTPPPSRPWKVRQIAGGEMRYIQPIPSAEDYPVSALQSGLQGTTMVKLVVSPDGAILSCETVKSAGSPDLDLRACQMYRSRGRFEFTGIDKPVTLQAPVTWLLADDSPPEPMPRPDEATGSPSPK